MDQWMVLPSPWTTAPHWGQDCSKERPMQAQDWVWTWPICTLIGTCSCNRCHPSCCHWKTVLPQASDTYPCRFTRSNASSSWIARPKPCHAAMGWHQVQKTWQLLAKLLYCCTVPYITIIYYNTNIWQKNAHAWTCSSEVDLSLNKRNEPRVDGFPSKAGWFAKFAAEWSVGFGPPILHRPCKKSTLSWHTIQRPSLCFPVVKKINIQIPDAID